MSAPNEKQGPKYQLDIEGNDVPWDRDTIIREEIIALGGWDVSQGAILIDKDNNERTLEPGEVVEIKPGMGFSKKVRFKRGLLAQRLERELAMLKARFADMEFEPAGQWVYLPKYIVTEGWNRVVTPVAFQIPTSYPGGPPYGFYVTTGILLADGRKPESYTEPAPTTPPFSGSWAFFSWTIEGEWRATADIATGSNLLNWALGFAQRFRQKQ